MAIPKMADTVRVHTPVDEWLRAFAEMGDDDMVLHPPGLTGVWKVRSLRRGLELGALKLGYAGLGYARVHHVRTTNDQRCLCAWCKWEHELDFEDRRSEQAKPPIKPEQRELPF